jgi:ribosomal protein S18 acetylase RimI-like enzyme
MSESQITLRDAGPEDIQFLAQLYRDTRRSEVNAWGWPQEQQELFLKMQFDAQRRSHQATFPDATDRIICVGDVAVGRMLVGYETEGMRLVDIALLEEYRNQGVGTQLIGQLMQDCEEQDRILRLQVLQGNPAIRLYRRAGFVQSSADQMYVQMEWISSQKRGRV